MATDPVPTQSGTVYCLACEASHERPVAVAVNDYCPIYEERVLTSPGIAESIRAALDEEMFNG